MGYIPLEVKSGQGVKFMFDTPIPSGLVPMPNTPDGIYNLIYEGFQGHYTMPDRIDISKLWTLHRKKNV